MCGVGVLIFVHQDFVKLPGQLLGQGGARRFSGFFLDDQQPQRPVFQVVEIHHPALGLFGGITVAETAHHAAQGGYQRIERLPILPAFRFRSAEKGRQRLDPFFRLVAQSRYPLLASLVLIL